MNETALGYCDVCQILMEFGSVRERNGWEMTHKHWGDLPPEPVDRWTQDTEAGAIGGRD